MRPCAAGTLLAVGLSASDSAASYDFGFVPIAVQVSYDDLSQIVATSRLLLQICLEILELLQNAFPCRLSFPSLWAPIPGKVSVRMGLMTISAELSKSATCLGCYVNAWIASAFPVVPLGVSSRSCSFVGIRFCKDTHRSMHFSDILTPARMRGHSRYGLTWLHGQQITAQKFGSGLPSGHHGGAYSA